MTKEELRRILTVEQFKEHYYDLAGGFLNPSDAIQEQKGVRSASAIQAGR